MSGNHLKNNRKKGIFYVRVTGNSPYAIVADPEFIENITNKSYNFREYTFEKIGRYLQSGFHSIFNGFLSFEFNPGALYLARSEFLSTFFPDDCKENL